MIECCVYLKNLLFQECRSDRDCRGFRRTSYDCRGIVRYVIRNPLVSQLTRFDSKCCIKTWFIWRHPWTVQPGVPVYGGDGGVGGEVGEEEAFKLIGGDGLVFEVLVIIFEKGLKFLGSPHQLLKVP